MARPGADMAFIERATAERGTLYLPWQPHNGLLGPDCHLLQGDQHETCAREASEAHPAWDQCKPGGAEAACAQGSHPAHPLLRPAGESRRVLDPRRQRLSAARASECASLNATESRCSTWL